MRTVDVESGKVTPVSMSASLELDAEAERAYMFEHVWRQTLKKFHDVKRHGVDWDYYKKAYARFLPHISTNPDFAEMLSEMLELGETPRIAVLGHGRPTRVAILKRRKGNPDVGTEVGGRALELR